MSYAVIQLDLCLLLVGGLLELPKWFNFGSGIKKCQNVNFCSWCRGQLVLVGIKVRNV